MLSTGIAFFALLQLVAGGFTFKRYDEKTPTVVSGSETLSNYLLEEINSVGSETLCTYKCASNYAVQGGCLSVHYNRNTRKCSLYSSPMGPQQQLKTAAGTTADICFDYMVLQTDVEPNDGDQVGWFSRLSEKITKPCGNPEPLGLSFSGSGKYRIRDNQISASHYDTEYRPQYARLKNNLKSWCMYNPVSTTTYWWMIKFDEFQWIHSLDFSGGNVDTLYTFKIGYSYDGSFFEDFTHSNGSAQIFRGPTDRSHWDNIYQAKLWRPLLAKAIRIYPLTWYGTTWFCFRAEFYGCPAQCREFLGLHAKEFSPSSFSSSGYENNNWKPELSGLKNERGSWHSVTSGTLKTSNAWLEIDLEREHVVTGVALQTPSDNSNMGISYYSVSYCSGDCNSFTLYQRKDGETVFAGPMNTVDYKTMLFDTPVMARKVRLIARVSVTQASGRWELLGCRDLDRVVEFATDKALGKTVAASGSAPILGETPSVITSMRNTDPKGLKKSCVEIPATPGSKSWATVDLEESQTIDEVAIDMPRPLLGLDPIGIWLFDFATGANDLSGNGNDGHVLPKTKLTTGIFGQAKGAFELVGNEYSGVIISNSQSENAFRSLHYPNSDYAIFLWVYPSSSVPAVPIFHARPNPVDAGCCGFDLWLFNNNELHTNFFDTSFSTATNVVKRDVWNFVGFMFRSSTKTLYFFVNNTLVSQWITPVAKIASNAPLLIGRSWHDDGRQLAGKVACLQIYNRLLTGDEMQDAMTCPWTNPTPIMFWPMDDDFGATDVFGGVVNATTSGVTLTSGYLDIPNAAYQFSGSTSSYVRHENTNGELVANDGFTVTLWYDKEASTSQQSLFQFLNKNNPSNVNFQLAFSSEGHVIFKCDNQPSYDVSFKWGSATGGQNQYKRIRQIAVTYSWSTNLLSFYYEGDYQGHRELPDGCVIKTDGPLRIGGLAGSEYDGKIACFQMFNKALSQREIIQTSRCPIKEIKPAVYTIGDPDNWVKDYSGTPANATAMRPFETFWFLGPYGSIKTHGVPATATGGLSTKDLTYYPRPLLQNFVDDFTLMTFVYLQTANKEMHVIVVESSTYSNIVVGVNAANQFYASIKCTSGGSVFTISGGTFVINTWFHVALIRSKATSSMFLYVNGIEVAQTTSGPSCTLETTTDFHIMKDSYHTSNTGGAMACFAGYEKALPSQFIHESIGSCPNNPRIASTFCESELSQRHGYWPSEPLGSGPRQTDLIGGRLPDVDSGSFLGYMYPFEVQVRGIGTKGHSDFDYWVTTYKFRVSQSYKFDGTTLSFYKDMNGNEKVFKGNSDRNTPVHYRFNPPLRGYHFRLYPLTWEGRPGIRVSLVGCFVNTFSCSSAIHLHHYGGRAYTASVGNLAEASTEYTFITADDGGSVWTYLPSGSKDEELWLQVNVGYLVKVTQVATRGSPSNNAWVTKYQVGYSSDTKNWRMVKESDGSVLVFSGNTDANSIVYNNFPVPVFLRLFRIYVEAWNNKIALRIGIYGCHEDAFDKQFPAVEVRLGNNSAGLTNAKIGETLLPAPVTDLSLTRIYVPPSTGRYLTVATRKTNQALQLCKVSAYSNERKNMAMKKQVVLQTAAFDSSAIDTAKSATDSKISQLSSEATGQVCVIGQPNKLVNDVFFAPNIGFPFGAVPNISCTGIVAQWSYVTKGQDRATRQIYFSTWNYATKQRLSYTYALDTSGHSFGLVHYSSDQSTGLVVNPGDTFATIDSSGLAYNLQGHENPLNSGAVYSTESVSGVGYVWTADEQIAANGYITPTLITVATNRGVLAKGYVTNPAQDAWIAVDFGAQAVVSHVAVYVAADQFGNSLQHSEVRIGDNLNNITSNPICDYQRAVVQNQRSTQRPYLFYCPKPMRGRYAIIRRRKMGLLPVAEILAF